MEKVFDFIAISQDKTMTGTWSPVHLALIIVIAVNIGLVIYNKLYGIQNDASKMMMFSLKIVTVSVILNYISGMLFKSRIKVYKKVGFSRQKAMAQAYADARMTQAMSFIAS